MLAVGTSCSEMPLIVRNYQSSDWDDIYDVCERTGDKGGDARLTFANPRLVPEGFAGPYLYLEPELAFVLDDGRRPVGYVIGTADTADFVRAYERGWLPHLAQRYGERAAPPFQTRDELFSYLMFTPQHMVVPEALERYPAHLHIDVLPPHQGKGFGRRLIETFISVAGRAGATGVHVSVDPGNERAHGFYLRLGFEKLELADPPMGVVVYGRTITAA